jgi:hypothetical protein
MYFMQFTRTIMRNKTKLHFERKASPNVLFSIEPALCGRRQPTDYRMFPPDDDLHKRKSRQFFTKRIRLITCLTCKRVAKNNKS